MFIVAENTGRVNIIIWSLGYCSNKTYPLRPASNPPPNFKWTVPNEYNANDTYKNKANTSIVDNAWKAK